MAQSSDTLAQKLHSLNPIISELLKNSGSPGLSIGVLHHGEVVHTGHYGRRDISIPGSPNDETIYHIISLTKLLTAATMGLLVDKGHIHWDTRIHEILPVFKNRNDDIGQEATLIDVLSNRTGLSPAHAYYAQLNDEIVLPKTEMTRMSCQIQAVKPFREDFVYSSWNYALVTDVIEKAAGKTFGAFVKEAILDPLDMQRTTIGDLDPIDANIALAHAVYNDGTAHKIPFPACSDREGIAGGFAAKSTIKDLLGFYKSILSSYNDQKVSGSTSTSGSPFKHLQTIFSPHVKLGKSQSDDQAYCLGLYKTKLPGNLGIASFNHACLGPKNSHFTGGLKPGLEVFHHTGNVPGALASMFLIPDSESAIVALSNSFGLSDPTDFIGRLLLSVILGETIPGNFVALSKLVQKNHLDSYSKLSTQLEKYKTTKPPSQPLSAYEGDYFNSLGNFFLRVKAKNGGLLMIVQNLKFTRYSLLPYDGDTFYWPANREQELCIEHRAPWVWHGLHKVKFIANYNGEVDSLTWDFDPGAKPQVFKRSLDGQMEKRANL